MKDDIQKQLAALRRNQILEAAARVFAQKGFHPTTTKDIAKEAGIAEGTIYNYFENKTALLLGIFDQITEMARHSEDFSQIAPNDIRSFMKAYIRQPLMALKVDNFQLFRVIVSEMMVNEELKTLYYQKVLEPTLKMAEINFQRWAAELAIKPDNLNLAVRAISGLLLGLIMEYIMGDQPLEAAWEELPEFLTDLILDGLGRPSSSPPEK